MAENDQNNGQDAKAKEPQKGEVEKGAEGSLNEAEIKEGKERFLRLAAEFDNYKKRVAKEMENAKDLGRAEVIKKLLTTVDEFELAISSIKEDDAHVRGIALVFSNFISSLKDLGVKEIEAKGRYDPYRHEIVLAEESNRPEGEILKVVRKGYMLNGIMIRPASVIIAKGKETAENGENGDKKS